MAHYDMHQFAAIEALRKELNLNRDLKDNLTQDGTLVRTLGEIHALLGIPVDLILTENELVDFIWTTVELLNRRRNNALDIRATQEIVDAEVIEELETGIIVTDEKIASASELQEAEAKTPEEGRSKIILH